MCNHLEPPMPEDLYDDEDFDDPVPMPDDDFDGVEYLRDKEIQEELWRERQE